MYAPLILHFSAALDTILELMQTYEANYPEMLRKAFVINGE